MKIGSCSGELPPELAQGHPNVCFDEVEPHRSEPIDSETSSRACIPRGTQGSRKRRLSGRRCM